MNKNYILGAIVGLFATAANQTALANSASVSITFPLSGVSIEVGVPQTIKWMSSDYPEGVGVDINLLRQISVNPNKFEFVKTIEKDTPNDGEEVWTPSFGDNGDNLVLQVSCSQSFVFPEGCSSANGSDRLAVIDKMSRQSYLASTISGINGVVQKILDFLGSIRLW